MVRVCLTCKGFTEFRKVTEFTRDEQGPSPSPHLVEHWECEVCGRRLILKYEMGKEVDTRNVL